MAYKIFDFFSGCGGVSSGFKQAGFEVSFALDSDTDALASFKMNFPNAHTINCDIRSFDPATLTEHIADRSHSIVFSGCAPCQPFSKQNKQKKKDDSRVNLLLEFSRVISYWMPDFIFMENVPGLQKDPEISPFRVFVSTLKKLGYKLDVKVIKSCDYGVPQRRERLILLGSLHEPITMPEATHGPSVGQAYRTVRDCISDLPPIEAGQRCSLDAEHISSTLSKLNLERIRCTPEGKGRESWPEKLTLKCHKNHNGHTDVYGRLIWDNLASGLTTRCNSLSNGRFGHPEQNRAISIREAALLQTFPRDYRFSGSLNSKARQIGNAVPPNLALQVALKIRDIADDTYQTALFNNTKMVANQE
jgi:DNA (cytosine-5)-methyltransferase 1